MDSAKHHMCALAAAAIMLTSLVTAADARSGGHGVGLWRGHGAHALAYGYPPGWSNGRKVGWRGYGCPPGLAKQGRC